MSAKPGNDILLLHIFMYLCLSLLLWCMKMLKVGVGIEEDINFYIINFVLYVSSNVLATRKWHCLVSAIYSTQ